MVASKIERLVIVAALGMLATHESSAQAAEALSLQSPAAMAVLEPLPPVAPDSMSPAGLALSDLEVLALARNPSLRRMAALVGAARGNALQAGLPPNPSVGYEGQQLGSGGLAEQHGVLLAKKLFAEASCDSVALSLIESECGVSKTCSPKSFASSLM